MSKEADGNNPVTIFIRCSALHSRGELVNSFLHTFREELGIEAWYSEDGLLRADAPVEIVEVKSSRKPYFLLEIRCPTPEELERRKGKEDSGIVQASVDDNPEKRNQHKKIAVSLLSLAEKVKEYNNQVLIISEASKGISVSEERKKLEERDRHKKREREEAEQKEAASRQAEGNKKESSLAFVPRAVRRRA